MVKTIGFCPQTCLIKNHIMQKYIVLLKRFHLNGNTNGFHPQTQKLELRSTYTLYYMQPIIVPCKSTSLMKRFQWLLNGHTIGFHPQAQKLQLQLQTE